MSMTTVTRAQDIPKLTHVEAMHIAEVEYGRFLELLRSLGDDDWSRPTDNDRWDVSQVVSHLVAMSQGIAGFPRELLRQQKQGKSIAREEGLSKFDGFTEFQSKMHGRGRQLIPRAEEHFARALRRRQRFPGILRPVKTPQPPWGWWSFAYMIDDILTRDVWMHRVDISRATGRPLLLTPEHDGRVVSNIVREFAAKWRRPFSLVLTGPVGGRYVNGDARDEIRLDAVEFCRILSGRSDGHGLPTDLVAF
jgi:uncharacterized protein (TIGR03083 family)